MNDASITRTAACACGALSVEARGEPVAVVTCHCVACQRRSGSPFGTGAYYSLAQTTINGAFKTYVRTADSGRNMSTHFCPRCGSAIFWQSQMKPDEVGVAVGAFGDPRFPAPVRSVWEQTRHAWINLGLKVPRFLRGRDSGLIPE